MRRASGEWPARPKRQFSSYARPNRFEATQKGLSEGDQSGHHAAVTETGLDVLAIGDAVVDVIATADDSFLVEEGLVKGSMRVLDAEGAQRLYARMGQARETSGGSAANTMAGVAALGGRAGFVGQVADDQLGEIFTHDIRALGVEFLTPPKSGGEPTGRCLILVTPDAQRTMNTFRGAAHELTSAALDPDQIRRSAILYLEAYLWRSEGPRAAMNEAMAIAHESGRKVAFTLSDIACIAPHRAEMMKMLEDGAIDLLFANEAEILTLADRDDRDSAIAALKSLVPLIVVTCGEDGAMAVERGETFQVPIARIGRPVVDTTGAGDLFAAGFLVGHSRGRSIPESLRMGSIAAAEVISHFGARPEADLMALIDAD
jgi:sugar/nucleoside kinase (ribokinase family)